MIIECIGLIAIAALIGKSTLATVAMIGFGWFAVIFASVVFPLAYIIEGINELEFQNDERPLW